MSSKPNELQPLFIGINDAARLLNVEHKTVRRLIAAGRLPAFRIPGTRMIRLRTVDVEALVTGSRITTAGDWK